MTEDQNEEFDEGDSFITIDECDTILAQYTESVLATFNDQIFYNISENIILPVNFDEHQKDAVINFFINRMSELTEMFLTLK